MEEQERRKKKKRTVVKVYWDAMGTPFPYLQFMTQSVPPPQIVIMLGKGTRPLSGVQN